MLKYLLIFLLGLLICQNVEAQKADTILYFLKKGILVNNKDSADIYRFVISPDTSTGSNLYTVKEYYTNGKPEMVGSSSNRGMYLTMQGPCLYYFPNGRRRKIVNFVDGRVQGNILTYYPNGKLYAIENIRNNMDVSFLECRDSTNKILSQDGKGNWIEFDDNFTKIISEGPVKDSLKNGEWHGSLVDSARYVINFKNGIAGSGVGYDASNKAYPFTNLEVQAAFNGKGTYIDFLIENIHYPSLDRENNVQGKVIVQFIVEIDGKPSHIKILREPDKSLGDEAARVVALMVWKPGLQYGIPVRSYFTLPMSFNLNGNGRH